MKKFGCLLAVLGVLAFIGSFVLFGSSIWRALEASKVQSFELKAGEKAGGELFAVSTEKSCQVAVRVGVKAKSVKKSTDADGDVDYAAKYKFPFSYEVTDAGGDKIVGSGDPLAWDSGTRTYSEKKLDETGGTVTVGHNLKKFEVRPPGRIRVEAEIKPDAEHGAELTKVEVEVYDNVSRHARSVTGGVLLLFGGPVLAAVGLVVFIAGFFVKGGRGARRRR